MNLSREQTQCKAYHDKTQRDFAYARLVENMKLVKPTATNDIMAKKKINDIKSVYRNEKNKMKESMKTELESKGVYEPKL